LTIEPGAQIWVNGQKGINVDTNSKLVAVGTAVEPVIFRGSADQAGWWTLTQKSTGPVITAPIGNHGGYDR